jgi:5-methylcytosine-specific restriction endonuclease McrA
MPEWSGSSRRRRLPKDWSRIRKRILNRDQHRCRHVRYDTGRPCGEYATEVDHIIPDDNDADSNLQALCTYHHGQKSGREGAEAKARERRKHERRLRRTEVHPALLEG